MHFYKVSSLVLIAFLLSSCVTDQKAAMQSWVGSSKDQLFMKFGNPDKTTKLSDGGELLEYTQELRVRVYDGQDITTERNCRPVSQTSGTVRRQPSYGGQGSVYDFIATTQESPNCTSFITGTGAKHHNETDTCRKRFKTNEKGTITDWSYDGC